MITGRWGKPSEVLLDITVDERGAITGVANPGRQDARIRSGTYDAATGVVHMEGEHGNPPVAFAIDGHVVGRELRLRYSFGDQSGELSAVRVEEYHPKPLTLRERIEPYLHAARRWLLQRGRPDRAQNAQGMRERGETLDSIVVRDATVDDVPALSELHVETWNATYRAIGPTVATRMWQWNSHFAKNEGDWFLILLENHDKRLIGFSWGIVGKPGSQFGGNLSKIYLRWEYHGFGLGRLMMGEVARRFLARGVTSMVLFADGANPTIGFYDHLGGERLVDDRGRFSGGHCWRDLKRLADDCPPR